MMNKALACGAGDGVGHPQPKPRQAAHFRGGDGLTRRRHEAAAQALIQGGLRGEWIDSLVRQNPADRQTARDCAR